MWSTSEVAYIFWQRAGEIKMEATLEVDSISKLIFIDASRENQTERRC